MSGPCGGGFGPFDQDPTTTACLGANNVAAYQLAMGAIRGDATADENARNAALAIAPLAATLAAIAAAAAADAAQQAIATCLAAPTLCRLALAEAAAKAAELVDEGGASALAPTKAIRRARLLEDNSSLTKEDAKKIVSMEDRAAEHRAKLEAYRRNPEGNDEKGILRGKASEVREQIIRGRIRHLQEEIDAWDEQTQDLKSKGR